jgi:hypothetical protein
MAVRWYAAFAASATLVFLWFAAGHAELFRLPWRPGHEAGLQSAWLRGTRTVDLETGNQDAAQADLHWDIAARDQPYLGVVQRGAAQRAGIAEAGALRWEDLDESALAKLEYSPNRYSAWGPDAPVRRGAVFAVRTAEGNLAKLRVAQLRNDYQLQLEWLLYTVPKPNAQQAAGIGAPPGPSPAWLAPRDDALAAYRAQRYQDALDVCGKALEAAEREGAAQHALALVTCGGLTELQRRAARQTETWLKRAVAIAMPLDQSAIVAALGPREIMLKERCLRVLGTYYRDQNRTREAAGNFALAVDTVRAMPPLDPGAQRLALRGDLHDLGLALAQLGLRGTARRALAEARALYVETEPAHAALKAIDEQLRRLDTSGNN